MHDSGIHGRVEQLVAEEHGLSESEERGPEDGGVRPTVSSKTMSAEGDIDPSAPPSGSGCAECLAGDGWWFHLRRCACCGHIGCCDSSPSQHASKHAATAGHPMIRSFEPGEDWFWSYATEQFYDGPPLAAPEHHPLDQPAPGPAGHVPPDWQRHLH